MKKKRIGFTITSEDFELAKEVADKSLRTISNLARHAFFQYLKRYAHYSEKESELKKKKNIDSNIEKTNKIDSRTSISPQKRFQKHISFVEIEYCTNPTLTDKCLDWFFETLLIENEGYVYFVKDNKSELVKIGYSINPAQRLYQLNASIPAGIDVLAVIKGSRNIENWLHKLFKKDHVKGEWFKYEDAIKQVIEKMKIKSIDRQD